MQGKKKCRACSDWHDSQEYRYYIKHIVFRFMAVLYFPVFMMPEPESLLLIFRLPEL